MWDDFDENEDWDEESEFDPKAQRDQIYSHPLMKKATEIISLTHALVGSLDEARKELYGGMMMEDATVMCSKFAGAEAVDDYILKMENATIMKVHARHLNSMTYQLAMEETHAEEHLALLREAIGEFKNLFVDWVKGFDPNNRQDDGWGLFV
ncbi:hypothetical protein J0A67_16995 [Algoriphagus aestuariicola]|jgi:hypothetical protein|uniref:Uncharacterized protein n=1 Tax=Algoriphagus aestuariicola TaxID=1852016 RepID=A0ABS3BW53_9BACT|nr:hypothetical protein [Algoriphagus aestuariicola]MBN7802575.1 hypothetical protein [Algoriphagus aestuariicola]